MPESFEVALFPIPNLVAFPGTVVPLHVFEPRYRQLVHDSVRDNRLVAVSHVLKTVSQPKQEQDLETALRSNQATYKPCQIFSAGAVEIMQTTDDGRLLAQITMTHRLTLAEDLQTLPYRIVRCTEVTDVDETELESANRMLQSRIVNHLVSLCQQDHPEVADALNGPEWSGLSPDTFSFKVFQMLRLDPDEMQILLELDSVNERLARLDQALLRA